MTGGQYYFEIAAYDNSTVNVLSGNLTAFYGYNNASINVSGGSVGVLLTSNSNVATVSGGTISFLATGDQTVANISGGSISQLDVEEAQSVSISGGNIPVLDSAIGDITVTGGSFSNFYTFVSGNVSLYGTNFSILNSTPRVITNSSYVYTGTLFTVSAQLEGSSTVGMYSLFDSSYRTVVSTGAVQATLGGYIFHDLASGSTTNLNANLTAPEPDAMFLVAFSLPCLGLAMVRSRKSKHEIETLLSQFSVPPCNILLPRRSHREIGL